MNRAIAAAGILSMMIVGIADQRSTPVSCLLSQARLEAIGLREDTNQMRDFVLIDVTWETHAVYANMILKDMRELHVTVEQLDKVRSSAMDWQKTVIDQINPLVNELTTTSEEIYKTIDERPFDRTRYNEDLKANYDHAEHLAALISDSVRYGNEKLRLQKAEVKLQSAETAK